MIDDKEIGQFLDLVVFWLAYRAYQRATDGQGSHLVAGVRLMRRYYRDMAQSIEDILLPMAEAESFLLRYKTPLLIASRPRPSENHIDLQGRILTMFFNALRVKQPMIREYFGKTRNVMTAQILANASSIKSPEKLLTSLVVIPPASGLQLTRTWVRDANRMESEPLEELATVVASLYCSGK